MFSLTGRAAAIVIGPNAQLPLMEPVGVASRSRSQARVLLRRQTPGSRVVCNVFRVFLISVCFDERSPESFQTFQGPDPDGWRRS